MADTENTPSAVAEQEQEPILTMTDEQAALMDAVSKWERAECFDCGAVFTTEAEAHFHSTIHEVVLHFWGARLVN